MTKLSAEQQARNLLERMEVPDAQSFSAGEVVELANLIRNRDIYRRALEEVCDMYITADKDYASMRMHQIAHKALYKA